MGGEVEQKSKMGKTEMSCEASSKQIPMPTSEAEHNLGLGKLLIEGKIHGIQIADKAKKD